MSDNELHDLIQYAYAHSAEVRTRFDHAGVNPKTIRQSSDLVSVPILSKDTVVELQQRNPPFGGLLTVPLTAVRRVFFSPGPLYEPDAGEDTRAEQAMRLALTRSGFRAGDVVLNSLSYHLVPAGLALDRALVAIGCTVIPGGTGSAELQLKMALDFGATGYVGTPSFLMSLIKKVEAGGANFKKVMPITKALTSAEPLPPDMRNTFVDRYGISIGNTYATAELGALAINTGGGMAMQMLPGPIIEVLDPETGKPVDSGSVGEVVVTTFNKAYPLVRLGTGDMAVYVDPAPGVSQQEERLITLVGRSGEAVKVRGMFVHPNQLRFAAAQVTQFSGIQGVVTRLEGRDHLTVRVALQEPEVADGLAENLKAAVQQICRVRADEIEFVSDVPAGARGMVDERNLY